MFRVKLAKVGLPKSVKTSFYETMKTCKITGKNNNISNFLIKRGYLIQLFISFDFRTCIFLKYRKATLRKNEIIFFNDIPKAKT